MANIQNSRNINPDGLQPPPRRPGRPWALAESSAPVLDENSYGAESTMISSAENSMAYPTLELERPYGQLNAEWRVSQDNSPSQEDGLLNGFFDFDAYDGLADVEPVVEAEKPRLQAPTTSSTSGPSTPSIPQDPGLQPYLNPPISQYLSAPSIPQIPSLQPYLDPPISQYPSAPLIPQDPSLQPYLDPPISQYPLEPSIPQDPGLQPYLDTPISQYLLASSIPQDPSLQPYLNPPISQYLSAPSIPQDPGLHPYLDPPISQYPLAPSIPQDSGLHPYSDPPISQYPSAAGPSLLEPEVPAVLPPRQSIHVNAHRKQLSSPPNTPRSRPPVYGFYSRQKKVGKTTRAKTTGEKTTSKRKDNDSGKQGGR